jgi:hypothetical protein
VKLNDRGWGGGCVWCCGYQINEFPLTDIATLVQRRKKQENILLLGSIAFLTHFARLESADPSLYL